MPIPWEAPRRVDLDPHVREAALIENPLAQRPLHRRLRAKLWHQDQWRGSSRLRQGGDGSQHFASDEDTTFDGFVAAVRHDQLCNGGQPGMAGGSGKPHQAWAEMRAVFIEISPEEGGHEQRYDGDR